MMNSLSHFSIISWLFRKNTFQSVPDWRFILLVLLINLIVTGQGRTQDTLPAPVLLVPPLNSLVAFPGEGSLVYFSWNAVPGAEEYLVNFTINSIPKMPIRTTATEIFVNLNLQSKDILATVNWSVSAVSGTAILSKAGTSKFAFGVEGTPVPTPISHVAPTPLPAPELLIPEDHDSFSAIDQLVLFDWTTVTGASAYRLKVYKENEIVLNRVLINPPETNSFNQQIYAVFQWDVNCIDSNGNDGASSFRRSFSIGSDFLPTPTPMPLTADIDNNGTINAADFYQFAVRYATNDPKTDLDRTGITTKYDLLLFLEMFAAGNP